MFCAIHMRPVMESQGGVCPLCVSLGIRAETVELDKVQRVLDTLKAQGYEVDYRRSHAVIVYHLDREGGGRGLIVDAGESVALDAWESGDGRASGEGGRDGTAAHPIPGGYAAHAPADRDGAPAADQGLQGGD